MSTPTGLPEGYSPPLSIVTPDNHSSWITITASMGLVCVMLCLIMRIYVRTHISPPFGWDDGTLVATTISSIIQSGIVFLQVSKSFGESIDLISPQDVVSVQKIAYANDMLFILSMCLTKVCVALLFMRLSPGKNHILVSKVVFALSIVWAVLSIFLVALKCDLSRPWIEYNQKCTGLFVRWQIITALDIIIEAFLFFMSIYLVVDLQMSQKNKFVVVLAFGFRLPIIVFAAFRLHYIGRRITSSNPTLDGTIALIWTQVELDYSVMACTIPCLKPFMIAVSTNYGSIAPSKATINGSAALSKGSKDSKGSFALSSVNRSKRRNKPVNTELSEQQLRPDRVYNTTSVTYNGQQDQHSVGSNESTKMIIKKETEWKIERNIGRDPNEPSWPQQQPPGQPLMQ
ncbi:hypothetical protein K432DRAFT_462498 [Lepidopterella palustris CBS 459.81]|uniref:Rhodopsin domain-containing protein n=1 Tax=Lepidopterella palustris CBS 459.81 TaxID=1314670 RepID=A0A8E2JBQ6_9PEZI|nr:hypothetical protein K432DRAFT_462498 [Lepidopterella palustris CBS 459.81]